MSCNLLDARDFVGAGGVAAIVEKEVQRVRARRIGTSGSLLPTENGGPVQCRTPNDAAITTWVAVALLQSFL